MNNLLRDLPDYLTWANRLALQMVRDNETPELERIMAHILGCERVWANRILCRPADVVPWPDWDLPECETQIPENEALYRTIADTVDASLVIHYKSTRGDAFAKDAGTLILHVFAHGAYHRGQIAQEVRRSGGEITDTDYVLFALNR